MTTKNQTNRPKLHLLLATMGMVFAGCAYGGDPEALDDSGETATVDQAATYGVGPYKTPKRKTIERGDTVRNETGSCETTVLGNGEMSLVVAEDVAAYRCVTELTRELCVGGTRTLSGIRWMRADCVANDDGDFECSADASVECVFKGSPS